MKKNKEGHQCTRNMKHMQGQIDVRSVVIHNMLMVLDVQLVGTNAEIVIKMFILVACATRRRKYLTQKGLWSQDHPKHINFRLVQFIHKIPYWASQKAGLVKIHSACKCNWSLYKLRIRYQYHNILLSKPNKNMCSSKKQSPIVLPAREYSVDQCVMNEGKEKTSKW